MILAEILHQKLNEWQPTGEGRQHFVDSLDEQWAVTIVADRVDVVGGLFWELTLQRLGENPSVDLTMWSQAIAKRATGLMEPLATYEIDAEQGVALLRSDAPSKRGQAKLYYELRLTQSQTATLRRYQYSPDAGKRSQVAFALTHESLAKLVNDLATAE